MELRYRFDPDVFRLGKLCKHGHRWPGTELGLRRREYPHGCVGCCGDKERNWLIRFIDNESLGLSDGWRLGRLCAKGHTWNDHQLTLRNRDGRCLECEAIFGAERSQKWRQANKERFNASVREREARLKEECPLLWEERKQKRRDRRQQRRHQPEMRQRIIKQKQEARDRLKAQGLTSRGTVPVDKEHAAMTREELNQYYAAIRNAGKLPTVSDLVIQEQRAYWKENPEDYMDYVRARARNRGRFRHMTELSFRLYHREKSKRRKAQERGALAVEIPVSALRRRFLEFGNCCAYCGEGGEMEIEHVVPISTGGPHDIGNIVPACHRCNMSKRNHIMETWYQGQPFFQVGRMQRIRMVTRQPAGHQLALAMP
jgi:5-methylcytosine-specific restriction endonuclease McrA